MQNAESEQEDLTQKLANHKEHKERKERSLGKGGSLPAR